MKRLLSFTLALLTVISIIPAMPFPKAFATEESTSVAVGGETSAGGIFAKEVQSREVPDGVFAALKTLPTVYVHSGDGSDDAVGSEQAPFKTLERAYRELTPGGGTVMLLASHELSHAKTGDEYVSPEPQIQQTSNYFRTPTGITGPVMLCGADPSVTVSFDYLTFNSDHYIDSLVLAPKVVAAIIECGFNNVTFGESISSVPVIYEGDERYPMLLGGYYQCGLGFAESDAFMQNSPYKFWLQSERPYEYVSANEDYTITVLGGKWRSVMGGNWRTRSDASVGSINADVTVHLGGGCAVIPSYSFSDDMKYAVSATGYCALSSSGTATLIISGGTYNCPVYVSGRIGTYTEAEGVTHASELHEGDLFCTISGGNFKSAVIGGTQRRAIISATQDGSNDVNGDYTLTIKNGAVFESGTDLPPAAYVTYSKKRVTGTKTAHIANYALPLVEGRGFDSYDFWGNESPVTLYVDPTDGNDAKSGLTAADAVKTLAMAYRMLEPCGGTMILTENQNAQENNYFETPKCYGPVTIKGADADIQLQINYFSIQSEHTFDNLTVYSRGATTLIECRFNNFSVTDSVKCVASTAGKYPFIVGGHYQAGTSSANFNPTKKTLLTVSTENDYTIDLRGGTWRSVKGGNWRHAGDAHVGVIDGDVTVNISNNATVAPYDSSSENYFVSPSGNNASKKGSFELNIENCALGSPVYGVCRIGTVSGDAASEYKGFTGEVSINIVGASIGVFAQGQTYEKKSTVRLIQDADATAPSFEGIYTLSLDNVKLSDGAVINGNGGDGCVSHIYTYTDMASTHTGFDLKGVINNRGNIIGDGDGDGSISNSDVTALVRRLSGYGASVIEDAADMSGDEKLNNRDAVLAIQFLAGWDIDLSYVRAPKINPISELNKEEDELDSHAGLEKYSTLELNQREYVSASGSELGGMKVPFYSRIRRMQNGKYIMVYQANRIPWNIYYAVSDDAITWQNPKNLFKKQAYPNGYADEMVFMTADLCVLDDGTIIVVSAFRGKTNYRSDVNSNGLCIRTSKDNGATWSKLKIIYTGTCWEPYIMQTRSGEVQVYFTQTGHLIAIHGYNDDIRSSCVGLLRSNDRGATWYGGDPSKYTAQIVMQQYRTTLDYKVMSAQMPSVVELNNGTMALVAETVTAENSYRISAAYSTDNWARDLAFDEEGPSDYVKNFESAGGPYLAQFPSGETVLSLHNASMRMLIGDSNARNFSGSFKPFGDTHKGLWSSLFVDGTHSILGTMANVLEGELSSPTSSALDIGRFYLNHAIDAKKSDIRLDGRSLDWSGNTSALFVGSETQAQMSLRFSQDDDNIYILVERLDEILAEGDGESVCIAASSNAYYTLKFNANGLSGVTYYDGSTTKTVSSAGIAWSMMNYDGKGNTQDSEKGKVLEIAVSKALCNIKGDGQLSVNASLSNQDADETVTTDTFTNISATDMSTWNVVYFK